MYPRRKYQLGTAALGAICIYLFATSLAKAETKQLPAFYGKVLPALTSGGTVLFSYTVLNDTGRKLEDIYVVFDKNVKLHGRTSDKLVYSPGLKALVWEIDELSAGASRTITIPVTYHRNKGTVEFCRGAFLAVYSQYWSTVSTKPCYNKFG